MERPASPNLISSPAPASRSGERACREENALHLWAGEARGGGASSQAEDFAEAWVGRCDGHHQTVLRVEDDTDSPYNDRIGMASGNNWRRDTRNIRNRNTATRSDCCRDTRNRCHRNTDTGSSRCPSRHSLSAATATPPAERSASILSSLRFLPSSYLWVQRIDPAAQLLQDAPLNECRTARITFTGYIPFFSSHYFLKISIHGEGDKLTVCLMSACHSSCYFA